MLRSCKRCGRIHEAGECPLKKEPQKKYERDSESDRFRNRSIWRRKSKQIKEDAQELCEVCRDKGKYVYMNLSVHHITAIKDDKGQALDDNNLICLCSVCHELAEAGVISSDYLRDLAQKRISRKR